MIFLVGVFLLDKLLFSLFFFYFDGVSLLGGKIRVGYGLY